MADSAAPARTRRAMLLRLAAAGGASVFLLAAAASGFGAPPVLSSVGHVKRHPTAACILSPGVRSEEIEVATARVRLSSGAFRGANVIIRASLAPTQRSWLHTSELRPGRYYVHVRGFAPNCSNDPSCGSGEQWSNVRMLVMPGPTRKPTAAERRAMLRAVHRVAPRAWRPHLRLAGVLVSNYAPWASGAAVGVRAWRRLIQSEALAFRRLARGWRPYLLHASCPPAGMPARIRRELKVVCF